MIEFGSLMVTLAKVSQVKDNQDRKETEETFILMEERKSVMNSGKHINHGVDAVMK
jgi:hypothetical protein